MQLQSLGFRSELIFTAFDGLSRDRGDHWAIHTLSNPNYFWGNLLIFDRPPKRGDYERWTELFRAEFTDSRIYHVTLAWDTAHTGIGDVSEFLERGFLLESTAVLSARDVVRPPRFNEDIRVRPIHGEEEWEQAIQIQIACAHDHLTRAQWESFYRHQSLRYQALEKAGFGHWYGAFLGENLVASLGIFHHDGLGRFQTVSTHPNFQRRGICQTLVHTASQMTLASGAVTELVMCADPEYHAIKIYESVGFKCQHTQHGVYWWDKARAPTGT
jgi:ribosomal protein S18 acetylase RimI-like enzyme